ncbi:dihydrolipoamide dehydrogenase [Gracilibacillus halotolerans]|uniref:Dihydrolipoyl dehydrogenase n=1 Tax=Gracilibacillus halotolerans TaxID=74386 RepID=A0A841RJS3_9BACI|nr:dihydrolipoamide dehydrogenase [Gracilibacillus halotolerans]
MAENYDLVILGGGTGGYVAAICASQAGLKTAIVESDKIGGVCLHKGCIPTKSLLKSAEIYQLTKHAEQFGVETADPTFNWSKVIARKDEVVNRLYNGVQSLMKQGKIDVYHGFGRLLGPSIFSPMAGSISVEYEDDKENDILIPKNVILATGSSANSISKIAPDGEVVITSDHLFDLDDIPQNMVIIGGGVIGIEWASLFADVGCDVTIVEASGNILPGFDLDIISFTEKRLKQRGINILKNALVEDVKKDKNSAEVHIQTNEENQVITTEKVLVAVGRKPNTFNIGLQNTEIECDDDGSIIVNEHLQTKESHIYAIGDVTGGNMLAHVAMYEARKAISHITASQSLPTESSIPSCVYSNPEIAMIGLTEQQALDQGYQVEVKKTYFPSVGKSFVNGEEDGFIKMISDQKTKDLIGIHIVGGTATELITPGSMAFYFDASPLELSEVIYPHPSMNEIYSEVALAIEGRKLHG